MRVRALAAALLLAGCLGASEAPPPPAPEAPLVTTTADGGVAGPGSAVRVEEAAATFHPLKLPGGRAKPPVAREIPGTFAFEDCNAWSTGVGKGWHGHDVRDLFEPGDVAHVEVSLVWTNRDDNWGEIHLFVDLPGSTFFTTEGTADARGELRLNWTGQLYWPDDDSEDATLGVVCLYGRNVEPIDYVMTIEVAYAANAVPANTPVLVDVPPNATRLLVAGVPVAETPVTSHFRVFAPDDGLLGEYALNSNERVETVDLPGPGAYVVLVDHTEGGFVSLGLDAAPADPTLAALGITFSAVPLLRQETPGPAAATVPFTLPRVPLALFAWADSPRGPTEFGAARTVDLSVEGPRGVVIRFVMEGFVAVQGSGPSGNGGGRWVPIPGPGWEIQIDHHAYAAGDHVARLEADAFRGEVSLIWSTYLRPGEEAAPEVL